MFKSKVPDIFCKNTQFFVHSAYVSSAYSTELSRDFVKHSTHWILILLLIMKFNLENWMFYLCPNVAGFRKNVLKRLIARSTFNKEKL